MKKIVLCVLCLALLLAGCGSQNAPSVAPPASLPAASDGSGKTAQDYLDEENAILAANNALWEKVFASMDKNVTEEILSSNYGDVLMAAVESAKEQFSTEEYEALKADAEKIREIETAAMALPLEMQDYTTAVDTDESFPPFTGKDFSGNDASSSLFAQNVFTVVNFWYNGCKPCVEELAALEALNQRYQEMGGELIGINVETLDGDAAVIAEAQKILDAKGATYRNIYFDSASEAGQFAARITAFPTTYVLDRNGKVVVQPLLGGVDGEVNAQWLQQLIDQAIANDTVTP